MSIFGYGHRGERSKLRDAAILATPVKPEKFSEEKLLDPTFADDNIRSFAAQTRVAQASEVRQLREYRRRRPVANLSVEAHLLGKC